MPGSITDALGQAVTSLQRYEQWSNALTEPARIVAMRFVELPIVNPTLMAKREVFELGYREGAWPEDYDLCLRALAGAQGYQGAGGAVRLDRLRPTAHPQ